MSLSHRVVDPRSPHRQERRRIRRSQQRLSERHVRPIHRQTQLRAALIGRSAVRAARRAAARRRAHQAGRGRSPSRSGSEAAAAARLPPRRARRAPARRNGRRSIAETHATSPRSRAPARRGPPGPRATVVGYDVLLYVAREPDCAVARRSTPTWPRRRWRPRCPTWTRNRVALIDNQIEIFRRGAEGEAQRFIPDGFVPGFGPEDRFTTEFPRAYVIPTGSGQRLAASAARLVDTLVAHDVRNRQATRASRWAGSLTRQGRTWWTCTSRSVCSRTPCWRRQGSG